MTKFFINPSSEDGKVVLSTADWETIRDELEFLEALKAVGVDNWEGYSEALKFYDEVKEEDTNDS